MADEIVAVSNPDTATADGSGSTMVVDGPANVTVQVVEQIDKVVAVKETEIVVIADKGQKGDPGDSIPTYDHVQTLASATWTINHNLGVFPFVQLLDSGNNIIEAEIVHVTSNLAQALFSTPVAGSARCI